MAIKYPYIRGVYPRDTDHPLIGVTWTEEGKTQHYCGYSWCKGECGKPALIIPEADDRPEMKAYGEMVAMGQLMQRWRVEWKGEKIPAPKKYWDKLLKMWWT